MQSVLIEKKKFSLNINNQLEYFIDFRGSYFNTSSDDYNFALEILCKYFRGLNYKMVIYSDYFLAESNNTILKM